VQKYFQRGEQAAKTGLENGGKQERKKIKQGIGKKKLRGSTGGRGKYGKEFGLPSLEDKTTNFKKKIR